MVEGWRAWLAAMNAKGLLGEALEDAEDQLLDSVFGRDRART